MLDWTREQLSEASQVPFRTLTRIEAGMVERPHARTLRAIHDALTAAGIEFLDGNGGGPGVRLTREAAIRIAVQKAKGMPAAAPTAGTKRSSAPVQDRAPTPSRSRRSRGQSSP
jgi:transcriptional regulator with XRE-family HTH domain